MVEIKVANRARKQAAVVLAMLALASCATSEAGRDALQGPYLRVLGTAQDGGCPQMGAEHVLDRKAWEDPRHKRLVTSVLIADPVSGQRWLLDASPDIKEQVENARFDPPNRERRPGRPPLFDGIFLTHAHIGHYTGLLHFGREAYAAEGQPVFASDSMATFLESNGPWELLVRLGHIKITRIAPGEVVKLNDRLSLKVHVVPHRAEDTDTLAFEVRGPKATVLYLPDIDKWELWDTSLESMLDQVDLALMDGTFYDEGEVPGRSMAEIPHPFMVETMTRLTDSPRSRRAKVCFLHLNHSNPASDPDSSEHRSLLEFGFRVASDGMTFGL
ncbi:MAG TPA: MBL fold metallo-hydrolase [Planctomycetota bacterium]|nr:MBL fold metallo-hydrolase [Planctomycetota bacterium]